MQREKFSSRLGFILISAGCAIGLGNVWRFPYIVGKYGGAAFVLIYLAFLLILGLPIMVMEFSVGRASKVSAALSFDRLEPKGTKWHWYKYGAMAGNYLLMMFYTTIAGWMILYFVKMATGQFDGLNSDQVGEAFSHMLGQPVLMTVFMAIAVLLCFGICAKGLQKGVERITKVMMVCLLSLMVVLAVRSVLLPGGQEGLKFYLYPDFGKVKEAGIGEVVYAAMGQAFFTLSIGIGALAIFGSYIGKERALTGEAVSICVLDTFVALMSGLIIFPSCFAYNVQPGIGIDYATGDNWAESNAASQEAAAPIVIETPTQQPQTDTTVQITPEPSVPQESQETTYVLNTNTMKFHYPSCSSVDQMKEKNKEIYTGNREDIINMGYMPCKRCNP